MWVIYVNSPAQPQEQRGGQGTVANLSLVTWWQFPALLSAHAVEQRILYGNIVGKQRFQIRPIMVIYKLLPGT